MSVSRGKKKREITFIPAEKFVAILEESQRAIDILAEAKISMVAGAFAGVSLIRMAISSMGGSVEWWCDVIRRGPESIEKFKVPEGAVLVDGPKEEN